MKKISLLCKPTMEPWQIELFDLKIEFSLRVSFMFEEQEPEERIQPLKHLIETVHLPFRLEDDRVNPGALDDSSRQKSLDILAEGIKIAGNLGASKAIMHSGLYRWKGEVVGEYGRLIDSLKELAGVADASGVMLCVENGNFSYRDCPLDITPHNIDEYRQTMSFTDYAKDWIQVADDVGEQNVRLCLDTSHSVTATQMVSSLDERVAIMNKFLEPVEIIEHVHWSGNHFVDNRGRRDSHLPVNEGSIPLDINKRISSLDATLLLEHKTNPEMFLKELEFIRSL